VTVLEQTNISADSVVEASLLIAELFGLGDEAEASTIWPVDDGDAVVAATVTGDLEGVVLLAVNDEVIDRIASDPERLTAAFQTALDALGAPLGVQLSVGEITTSDVVPSTTAEIRDGNKLCALFGVSLQPAIGDGDQPDGADGADGGAAASTASNFEPSNLASQSAVMAMMSAGPLNVLNDVEMDVTVELGRTTMPIRELLSLQPGMVVEIDRAAGAPIDVLVNGHLIACGEVVVIDEEFGVRITEIVANGHEL